MVNTHLFDEEVGLLKRGYVVGYDSTQSILKVKLSASSALRGQAQSIDVPLPLSLFYNNGLFMGANPVNGTPVVIGQGSGGQYYFVSYLAENLPLLPSVNDNTLLLHANDNTEISINTSSEISVGSTNNKIHINTSSNLITTNFYNENHFTQASRDVDGVVKRDLIINLNFDQNSKLEDDMYDPNFFIIGMDPSVTSNTVVSGVNKNPPFVEKRELVYEFQYSADVSDDLTEANIYSTTPTTNSTIFTFPNRRVSRSDTLSLALTAPNYLMETIKGTVVDIFGNILDLNRYPLPVGQDQNTIGTTSTNKQSSFNLIKQLERKSLAYHFEINARKDLTGQNGQVALPDITSNDDYARNRSRFFLDIDKEGQFKLNVPASSETGNIPLLSRYENYSTFGPDDNNNPNKLVFRDDNLDIFQDSFAAPIFNVDDGSFTDDRGSVNLVSSDGSSPAPADRITTSPIRHGTAFHDVLSTCYASQSNDSIKFVFDPNNPIFSRDNIDGYAPLLSSVVTDTITVDGYAANAGGRSGSITFDGSIDFNIGANTIDRQSLWLDTAGGIVANIGRDLQNNSAAISMNGNLFIQVGGMGVSTDSRFIKQNNGQIGAAVDFRIFNSGLRCTWIRIDDGGVKILTPGGMSIHSQGDMRITSDSDIAIECETLTIQNRMVLKEFGGSI